MILVTAIHLIHSTYRKYINVLIVNHYNNVKQCCLQGGMQITYNVSSNETAQ